MIDRVLFLMEKYCDADSKCGLSNSEHQVVEAIQSTGLAGETKHFYYELFCQMFGMEKMVEMLLETCRMFKPDLIIYTPLGGALGDRLNPPPEVIRQLADSTKLFMLISDAKPACGLCTKWFPFADYVGTNDSIAAYRYYKGDSRAIMAYRAASPTRFYNQHVPRDIDVSFVGSIDPSDVRWPMRYEYMSFLLDKGVNMFIGGGQRGRPLPVEEYASVNNKSKIALGFSQDGSRIPILKQRVFEVTSCGALLMEDYPSEAMELLKDGEDFVTYRSKDHLLELIQYYLQHNEERERIAQSGYEKARDIYNARNYWGYTFEKMGFELPHDLAQDENYLRHRRIMEGL